MMHKGADKENRNIWVLKAYELFGKVGKDALNVEKLSLLTKLSRSSFYHYFRGIHRFQEVLFDYHVERFKEMGDQAGKCKCFDPDLLHLISSFKNETLFQRYLLIHESESSFKTCFTKAKKYTEPIFLKLWNEHLVEKGIEPESVDLYRILRDYFLLHHEHLEEAEMHDEILRLESTLSR